MSTALNPNPDQTIVDGLVAQLNALNTANASIITGLTTLDANLQKIDGELKAVLINQYGNPTAPIDLSKLTASINTAITQSSSMMSNVMVVNSDSAELQGEFSASTPEPASTPTPTLPPTSKPSTDPAPVSTAAPTTTPA